MNQHSDLIRFEILSNYPGFIVINVNTADIRFRFIASVIVIHLAIKLEI